MYPAISEPNGDNWVSCYVANLSNFILQHPLTNIMYSHAVCARIKDHEDHINKVAGECEPKYLD